MTTANELREQADRLDREAAESQKGKVIIEPYTGGAFICDGTRLVSFSKDCREASEAEVQALCTIPEFQAHLKRVRGEA